MYNIKFVANEPLEGEVELDLAGVETRAEAKEFAQKQIRAEFPTYEDIEIIGIEEVVNG